ncbi:MAG: twin-arginine translocation signal domain-containing protein [Gammaproteobacteria bacterium]|nr:twin-arginine translocation signal domain-containing protein [Gammaproteobacteria bacterium]
MNKKSQLKSQERREFIKKSTLVGSAVAASTMASTNAIAQVGTTEEKPRQKGYQLTQHVIDYYKSADI